MSLDGSPGAHSADQPGTQDQPVVEPTVNTAPAVAGPHRWWSSIPSHLGRARTSTLVLVVLFLAIGTLYLYVKPAPPGAPVTTGSTGGAPATTAPAPTSARPSPTPEPTTTAPGTTAPSTTPTETPPTQAPTGPTESGTAGPTGATTSSAPPSPSVPAVPPTGAAPTS